MVTSTTPPDLFSQFLYHDAAAGIDFLERAFGFVPAGVYADAEGRVAHAELRVGRGFVMTASYDDASKYRFVVPRDVGDVNTGSIYIGTPDVDAIFSRASAAGAEIVQALKETDYGSRAFSARDREGVLWHFGTYRPTVDGEDAYASPTPDAYCGWVYEDPLAAIAWLEKAFGFEKQAVHEHDGKVAHAQMRFGNNIFMTGSARDDEFKIGTPRQLGGRYTHVICGYTSDPDEHCARARAAGATIIDEPEDKPYGEAVRIYVAQDPEGYVWSFGTYRPGAAAHTADAAAATAGS